MREQYGIIGSGIPEVKASLLWDEQTDAWTYQSNDPRKEQDRPKDYYKILPTLYRAVDKRAKAISDLPFAVTEGEGDNVEEIDDSQEWRNIIDLIPNMKSLLWIIEASLALEGTSYLKPEKNVAGYDKLLRHLDPTSITLDKEKAEEGVIEFLRQEHGKPVRYTAKELIYIWYFDPYVEIGPPTTSPAKAALAAAGVLTNMDAFAKLYFSRGAIKATLFAAGGMPKEEAERFEAWWRRFVAGVRNAFTTKIVNADKVTPIVVGEGIKELEQVTLNRDKQEEIAMAMDIPFAILFSNAANYATAEMDKLNWYKDFVVPEANFIAAILNERIFEPLGLRFVFKPETLDMFQEDEEQRAQAMSFFMDAVTKAGSLAMAQAMFNIFGVEIDAESMKLIEQHFEEKEERREEFADKSPGAQPGVAPAQQEQEEQQPPQKSFDPQMMKEISIWRSKVVKAVRRGDPADSVPWRPQAIPADLFGDICEALKTAETEDEVADAFLVGVEDEPEAKSAGDEFNELIAALLEGIRAVRETAPVD